MTNTEKLEKLAAYEDAYDRIIMGESEITIRWADREITLNRPNVKALKNEIQQLKTELGLSNPRFYNVRF